VTGGPERLPVSVYCSPVRARLTLLLLYLLYWLAFFAAIRLVFLAFFYREALALPAGTLLGTLWHGLPLDLSATAYLSLVPFLLMALSAIPPLTRIAAWITIAYTVTATAVLSLLAAADLEIFRQWGRRIDAAVLQYLTHPREIWAAAGGGSPWLLLGIFAALTALFLLLARRVLRPRVRSLPAAHPAWAMPLAFAAALLIIPARGGIQQIPINQSSAYFTAEPFANQAAVNAGWNFFDSWLAGLNRIDNPYAVMSPDSARILIDEAGVDSSASPTRLLSVDRPNVILILWESLTARAVGRLGGIPGTTPEFERLADSGLLFTHVYAAGDRTDKGLAALLSGAPTVPNASILKVPSKVRSLPMLSRDLHDAGYATAFYYGGELGFANIKGFALEGRFDRIVGKYEFPAALRTSKWGAHDEAVADRVLADLRDTREPFLATWLTLSSHEPFDVPGKARITGTDGESRFRNSLAYTDHVVGEFIRRAAREPWWERTLVIIVSDHSKKLERTDAAAPYKSAPAWYHIPMLWTGGALAHRETVVDRIMSQTDLTPTILGQLALPNGNRYKFGRDVFSSPPRSFAYYGFDGGFGVVTAKGSLVWEQIPNRITSQTGSVDDRDFRRGRAMLQLTFQDYLDR
jgi:phosphoglycerol transferase MdoB-like AlkP superfamily enzyme